MPSHPKSPLVRRKVCKMWQYEAIDGTSFVTNLREENCKQKPVLVIDARKKAMAELTSQFAELLHANRHVFSKTQRWEIVTAEKLLRLLAGERKGS